MTPCPSGKRGYPSPHTLRIANSRNGKRIRAYRCPDCGLWHATATNVEGRTTKRRPA